MADEKMRSKEVGSPVEKKKNGSIRSIFMHADGVDMWLMTAGFIGAVADGAVSPLIIYLTGRMFNNVGGANSASAADMLTHNVRQVALSMVFTACRGCVAAFLGEFVVKMLLLSSYLD
ncbi:hypothetical protein CRYUN_Cryun17cG0027700 [Craigia yunnanensis]